MGGGGGWRGWRDCGKREPGVGWRDAAGRGGTRQAGRGTMGGGAGGGRAPVQILEAAEELMREALAIGFGERALLGTAPAEELPAVGVLLDEPHLRSSTRGERARVWAVGGGRWRGAVGGASQGLWGGGEVRRA